MPDDSETRIVILNSFLKVRGGVFSWAVTDHPVPVHCRRGGTLPKIELICDEELAETVKLVLRNQFATMPDKLIIQASRLLGFLATSEATAARIDRAIEGLPRDGILREKPDGMLDLA